MKFFVDPAWRRALPHIPLLYPVWGNAASEMHPFQRALFETYEFDTNYYSLVADINDADMLLMPYSYNIATQWAPDVITLCAEASRVSGKPILIDGSGDIERPITIPNSIVLRYGGYRSEKKANEITIPLFADDLLERYCAGELRLLEKKLKPTVGFSGWATLSSWQTMRALVKELPTRIHGLWDGRFRAHKKGIFFRQQALRVLSNSPRVGTSFVARSSYSGHLDTASASAEALQREFVDNLIETDYALDVRGDANNSIRLFEILSLGCIPLVVDTERNFPFSDILDYSSFACIVDFRDIEKLPEKLMEFHATLTPEKYVEMQRRARAAYQDYFRVDALTPHLIAAVKQKLSTIATGGTK